MIPSDTIRILGRTQPNWLFESDNYYALRGLAAQEIEALMRRLFLEQRMGADEMRDWANLLFLRLSEARELPILTKD